MRASPTLIQETIRQGGRVETHHSNTYYRHSNCYQPGCYRADSLGRFMTVSDWIALGATPAVIMIFVMGMGWASFSYFMMRQLTKRHEKEKERQKELYDSLKYKYDVINTWAFCADTILKLNKLKCGNSQGDVMLDWDGVPDLQNTKEEKS